MVYNDGACSNSDVSKGFKDSQSNRLRDTLIQILNHVLALLTDDGVYQIETFGTSQRTKPRSDSEEELAETWAEALKQKDQTQTLRFE